MSVLLVCDGKSFCSTKQRKLLDVSVVARNAIRLVRDVQVEHLCNSCYLELKEQMVNLDLAGNMVVFKPIIIKRRV